ncbi:unnamed protein product [Rotaria sp. Silwood1]|nr:unnamed protein product [Rotaria sp. Silwood1]
MLTIRKISFVQRSISIGINARRFRSTRHYLSPVVRQILSKDPSYAVRFVVNYLKINNILFNNIQEQLVELKISSRQIPKDDFILETNEDENDLPHPPIVAFPSIENHFHMDLETEDPSIPIHETARCFGCGASLQCADKTKP